MTSNRWNLQDKFEEYLIALRCVGFYPEGVKLKSGRVSYHYVNLRETTRDISNASILGNYIVDFAERIGLIEEKNMNKYTIFYGVPEGATKAGFFAQLAYFWNEIRYSNKSTSINSINSKGLYHMRTFENFPYLVDLGLLNLIVFSLINERIEEVMHKIDAIYGDSKSIYRELAFLLAARLYQITGKNYILVQGRQKPKKHGLPQDRYFIGKPEGKVLILAPDFKIGKRMLYQILEVKNVESPIYLSIWAEERINYVMTYLNGEYRNIYDVIMIEDVTTTGDSLIKEVVKLKDQGMNIKAVIALHDRNEVREDGKSIKEILITEFGIPYYAMSNSVNVLSKIAKKENIQKDIIKKVIEYYKRFGTEECVEKLKSTF